jgi:hypothetical protein
VGPRLEDLDREHVAGLRAAHEHRAGHWVDPVEIKRGRRLRCQLATGSIGGFELNRLA